MAEPRAVCEAGTVIEARDVRVARGGRTIVDVPAFALSEGETHVLLGPNGAGKSTLLRVLNGLEEGGGTIVFRGEKVASGAGRLRLRRATAAVFQHPYLLAASVLDNVAEGLRLRGTGRDAARERAVAALDLLGVSHLAQRTPARLSGGEAQRVSLARALAVDPVILFLDEPMASLDPPTRRTLLADLAGIFATCATAVVWVTHDREEAHAVADTVSFMAEGRVIQSGTAAEVLNRPATAAVADFLGVESWIEGRVERADDALRFVGDSGAAFVCGEAPEGPAIACVHPEDVVLFRQAPAAGSTSLRNVLPGRVTGVRERGRLRLVDVDCTGLPLVALVTQAACDELDLVPGRPLHAAFKATAVQVLPRASHLGVVGPEA